MAVATILLALAAAPSAPFEVTHVGFGDGCCVYSTGDVLMNASDFRDDLRERFATKHAIIIFHDGNTPKSCLAVAQRIARRVGFQQIRVEFAPKNLDMNPPRQ